MHCVAMLWLEKTVAKRLVFADKLVGGQAVCVLLYAASKPTDAASMNKGFFFFFFLGSEHDGFDGELAGLAVVGGTNYWNARVAQPLPLNTVAVVGPIELKGLFTSRKKKLYIISDV